MTWSKFTTNSSKLKHTKTKVIDIKDESVLILPRIEEEKALAEKKAEEQKVESKDAKKPEASKEKTVEKPKYTKSLIKKGSGSTPKKGDLVAVRYKGTYIWWWIQLNWLMICRNSRQWNCFWPKRRKE